MWGRLHEEILRRLDDAGLLDLSRAVLDSTHVPAKKGGEFTGPSPVDHGKAGSKMHVLSDANGLPLIVDSRSFLDEQSGSVAASDVRGRVRAEEAVPLTLWAMAASGALLALVGIGSGLWRYPTRQRP